MSEDTAVEMFVGGLLLDPHTQAPVVVLKDETGEIHLPIWIGIAEATSIASAIKQVSMARPLTHDLMHEVFLELGVRVERIMITELKDSTYFAELILAVGDKAIILDSRPSDAIAIALRAAAPIFVAQQVLEKAKVAFSSSGQLPPQGKEGATEEGSQGEEDPNARIQNTDFKNIDKDRWQEILNALDPDDFKYKM
ncbi:MAG: bifunctional nuclease family protein [Oligoflexia bacterium]|nr:bifunctional nuclease family protein [Oligoflexia bacterium]